MQDAYSLRCIPQVHGAVRDALDYVTRVVDVEMNAATDNPMVFADTGELLSGGNFHGEPVAIAADVLAIAVAELGAISERRTERLVNPALSGLPAFLTDDGGLRSGFMIAHVTAAALASENKSLAHPASVDSIPTSANKEDHVSMGVTAARKAARAVANTRRILAIEALAACQALDFRKPLQTSAPLQAAYRRLRRDVPRYDRDRVIGPGDRGRGPPGDGAPPWPTKRPRSAVPLSSSRRSNADEPSPRPSVVGARRRAPGARPRSPPAWPASPSGSASWAPYLGLAAFVVLAMGWLERLWMARAAPRPPEDPRQAEGHPRRASPSTTSRRTIRPTTSAI